MSDQVQARTRSRHRLGVRTERSEERYAIRKNNLVSPRLKTFARFIALVVLLNVIRYAIPYELEELFIFSPLMSAMEKSASYFNTNFSMTDWVTSFFYNFIMWLTISWIYFYIHPAFQGSHIVKSFKLYSLAWLLFASISAIYMNHYSHPKSFYVWNVIDGLLVFPIVALANGILYPRFFKEYHNQALMN